MDFSPDRLYYSTELLLSSKKSIPDPIHAYARPAQDASLGKL